MIKFSRFLIHSNLYIAINSAALFLYYSFKSEANFFISNIVLIFCLTYLGYHILRFIPWKLKGQYIGHQNIRFYHLHKKFNFITSLIVCALLIFSLFDLNRYQYYILILITGFGLMYENIFFTKFSLRSIPFSKPLFIAFTWSLTCVALLDEFIILNFIDCFVFILLLSIPFDIKDIKQDKKEGLKTFATEYLTHTKTVVSILFFIYGMLSVIYLSDYFFIAAIPIYISLIYYPKKTELTYYFGFDSLILLRSLFYFL